MNFLSLDRRLPSWVVNTESLFNLDERPGIPGQTPISREGLPTGPEEWPRLATALRSAQSAEERENDQASCEKQKKADGQRGEI